ncbi:agmatinase [Candidatus Micrarchaeota archaeon]|nr:agmatinase [Candidatus Micrarchaeota archaeon]
MKKELELLHSLPPYNFAGLEDEHADYAKARFVVIPIPFDSTTSFKSGAREAPHAIINSSRFLEMHDHELDFEAYRAGIHTTRELAPARGDVTETLRRTRQAVGDVIDAKKVPIVLGGDHSLAIACIQAFAERKKDFSVLALDAHADCWPELDGTKYSHASVGTRVADLGREIAAKKIQETIVGVRSFSRDEEKFVEENKIKVFHASDFNENKKKIADVVASLKEKNVYLTVDFDVFDPSVVPSVGTPEPGGLDWKQVTALIEAVARKKRVIGADFCELTPIAGFEAPNFLAAKLIYKTIGAIAKANRF